jgi:LysR substrate binding domain
VAWRRELSELREGLEGQIEIQRGLDEFTIDVGVTYLDNDPLSRVRTVPLYRERYVLITHEGSGFAGLQSISWAKAATVPLCLLTPSMQNRRIIDMQFHAAGAKQRHGLLIIPLVEPESFHTLGLLASAREPLAPLPRALLNFAEGLDLTSEIERRVAQT